jgi:hypothetical protein
VARRDWRVGHRRSIVRRLDFHSQPAGSRRVHLPGLGASSLAAASRALVAPLRGVATD